jgi:pyruvate kinase
VKVSDAIMVARGDLGVELSLEMVPIAQKIIIQKANEARVRKTHFSYILNFTFLKQKFY